MRSPKVPFPSDLQIARNASLKPIEDVAGEMGIGAHLLEPYGRDVLKIRLDAIEELADRPKAKYVVVSAVTPTPLGEGKTTTTVGLGQAMKRIGKRATVAIRQPSMGPDEASLREKIETVATAVYGADGVDYDLEAARQLDRYERAGFGRLPVCIAKTHLSISSDASLKGAPTGWRMPVREVRASVGAGFIYPICGDMRTMPGLGANPAAHGIDIDENGEIVGLS
jgi:formyltetrahydrofolate synthetase